MNKEMSIPPELLETSEDGTLLDLVPFGTTEELKKHMKEKEQKRRDLLIELKKLKGNVVNSFSARCNAIGQDVIIRVWEDGTVDCGSHSKCGRGHWKECLLPELSM